MLNSLKKVGMMVALLAAVAVGSAVIANAASDKGATGSSGATGQQGGTAAPPRPQNQTPLTGDTADKVTKAADDKVPGGTVLRVEGNRDGSGYHAHIRKSDGTEVVVEVNKDFEATAVEEHSGRDGGHRGGGRPGGPRAGETPLTGDTADKVTKAAQDKVSGGTVVRVETDADGSPYEAHVRKSDGTEVVVKVNKDFNVTAVEDHAAGPKHP